MVQIRSLKSGNSAVTVTALRSLYNDRRPCLLSQGAAPAITGLDVIVLANEQISALYTFLDPVTS